MSTDLAALIERLEKALGEDRELDREIAVAIGWQRRDAGVLGIHLYWKWRDWSWAQEDNEHPPRFTSSLDAVAVQAIPQGCFWHVGYGRTRDDEPLGGASIIEPGSLKTISEAESPSAPIALCIAALRARLALSKAGGTK